MGVYSTYFILNLINLYKFEFMVFVSVVTIIS